MNKNILLSMATMLSMNAEAEQKPGIFQRCREYIRNNQNASYATGATVIIVGCVAIVISMLRHDHSKTTLNLYDDTSTEIERKALAESIQNELTWLEINYTSVSGIPYYTFDFQNPTADQSNKFVNAMQRILITNPSAIMIYPLDGMRGVTVSHDDLKIMYHSYESEAFDMICNEKYWHYMSKNGNDLNGNTMRTHHLTSVISKQSIMIMILNSDQRNNNSNAMTQISVNYTLQHEACAAQNIQTANFVHVLSHNNVSHIKADLCRLYTERTGKVISVTELNDDVYLMIMNVNITLSYIYGVCGYIVPYLIMENIWKVILMLSLLRAAAARV